MNSAKVRASWVVKHARPTLIILNNKKEFLISVNQYEMENGLV